MFMSGIAEVRLVDEGSRQNIFSGGLGKLRTTAIPMPKLVQNWFETDSITVSLNTTP